MPFLLPHLVLITTSEKVTSFELYGLGGNVTEVLPKEDLQKATVHVAHHIVSPYQAGNVLDALVQSGILQLEV